MSKKYEKEFLIKELQRFYKKNDRLPTSRELRNSNGYPNWISYKNHFGSLRLALEVSGLPLNGFRIRPKYYTNLELIKILIDIKNSQGVYPEYSSFNKKDSFSVLPHTRTFENRFGTYKNATLLADLISKETGKGEKFVKNLLTDLVSINKKLNFKINIDDLHLGEQDLQYIIVSLKIVFPKICNDLIETLNKLIGEN